MKLKWVAIILTIVGLSIMMGTCNSRGCSPSVTNSIITVDSNLVAEDIKPGMVYDKDFTMDDAYHTTFVKVIMCSDIHETGGTIYYTIDRNSACAPYFMWVCYPQITKDSRATVIAIWERDDGEWVVVGVFRKDTNECLWEFGGTYGTNANGW